MDNSTYVRNILAVWNDRNEEQEKDGREWYPAMARIMREHAKVKRLSVNQVAGVYAATSINTGWSQNLTLAARALEHGRLDGGTLGMVCEKVNAILGLATGAPLRIDAILSADAKSMKIKNFWRNLSGNYAAVTVDRWARRIATGDYASKSVPKGAEYLDIAAAYVEVARIVGETPATVQAVTWCVARGTGA